jgi:hypothetical protein
MTANTPRLTDDRLRQALTELAAGPDADMLLTDVLRSVDSQPQVARRPWDTRGWGRAALLVAAAVLLVAATIGATLVLTRPQPQPQPTRTPLPLSTELIRVPDFFAPFTYRVPLGMSGKLQADAHPDGFYAIKAKESGSATVTLFYMTGGMHGCPVDGDDPKTNDDVSALLQSLDEGPVDQASLGGLPALTVGVDPSQGACRNAVFHLHGLNAPPLEAQLSLARPGRLIAASTGAGTLGVLISAPTDAALAEWLPVADALVSGIQFDDTALSDRVNTISDFVVPFTYRMPVGIGTPLNVDGGTNKVYFLDSRVGRTGRLELFPVSGYVHGCGASSGNGLPTSTIANNPVEYLDALREPVGAGIGPTTTTTLGNLPAVAADVDPAKGTCSNLALHIDGLGLGYAASEPRLNSPGRLIVARVSGHSIGVFMSAPSDQALADWLPIAQAYVDGMVFEVPN